MAFDEWGEPTASYIWTGYASITANFPSGFNHEIVGDYVQKYMLVHHFSHYYSRKYRRMVCDQLLSLRNNWLEFKSSWKLPIILEGIYRKYIDLVKKTRKNTTCNMLD